MAKIDKNHIRGWLVDLNGVLYVGGSPIADAREGLQWLRETGKPCRFATNTTTRSAVAMAEKLANLGFDIAADELITAPQSGVRWLRSQGIRRCHFVIADELRESEFGDFEDAAPGESEAVVIGDIGSRWNYQIMNDAFRHLQGGAQLLALHQSRFSETENGLVLDIGAFVAGLAYASGQEAVVVGKPSRAFFERALEQLGCRAGEAAMIGDDIEGDIGGAQRSGLIGILTRTGKYREELATCSSVKPDLVVDSIATLADQLA